MKKILSLLTILMMAMTAWAQTVYEATSWEGIKSYLNSPNKSTTVCKLMNDIDFHGGTIEPLDKGLNITYQNPLSDFTIDGNGHTLKNGTVTDMVLLSFVKNGTIKNLKFDNIKSCLVGSAYGPFQFENLSFNNCSVTTNQYAGLVCEKANGTAGNKITFSDITVTHCSVAGGVSLLTSGYDDDSCPVGVIAGYSAYSTINNCHVSETNVNGYIVVGGLFGWFYGANVSNCSFLGKVYANGYNLKKYAKAGGIAGKATGSGKISNCQNYGEVEGDDNSVGGIAGYAVNTTIENCKNTGWIHHKSLSGSDDEIGGILGYGKSTNISKCINEGSVDGGDEHAGGIAGLLEENSSITHCVNGGFVNGDDYVGGIAGQIKDNTTVNYCIGASNRIEGSKSTTQILVGAEPSGSTSNNYWVSTTSNIDEGAVTEADLKSGKVAWHISNKLVTANQDYVWGQAMTNQGNNIEDYPTPGGKRVYQHTTNCKSETCEFYSNYEHNHYDDIVLNNYGEYVCTYCNQTVEGDESLLTGFSICNAQDLKDFSDYINAGHPVVTANVYNDIDCTSLSSFTPIGNQTNTYCGTFDGQGYRIKNLSISGSQNGLGLFGALGNGATIKNVILDSSCNVTGVTNSTSQAGIAGIAGCVYAPSEQTTVNVSFQNCGNEAAISGFSNVGGILGGVYNNDNIHVSMNHCYNTGAISATETSAALAGWLYKHFDIKDCWNSGTVTHSSSKYDKLVYRRADDASLSSVSGVYSTVPQEGEGVTTITAADVTTGRLCYLLNGSTNSGSNMVWGQELETEKHPTFSTVGVTYKRTMNNQWGTISLPYAIQSNDDVQLYTLTNVTITSTDGTIVFAPNDEVVDANTPCVFKKKNAEDTSVTFPVVNDAITVDENPSVATGVDGWTMKGTYTKKETQTGIYFIAQDQFWYAESAITIAPFRAWFTAPTPNSAKAINIVIEEEATAISEVRGERLEARDGKFLENGKVVIIRNGKKYNINGQRIK